MGSPNACLATSFSWSVCDALWMELGFGNYRSRCANDLQANYWRPEAEREDRSGRMGVEIEGEVFTKDAVVKALVLTLSSEQGKRMRGKAEALRELAMKAVVVPNGSSNENFTTLVQIVAKSTISHIA